jgi:hypothetical protein
VAPSGRGSPSTTIFPSTTVPVASCIQRIIHRGFKGCTMTPNSEWTEFFHD